MKKKFLILVAACLASSYGVLAQLDPDCTMPETILGCGSLVPDGGLEHRFAEPWLPANIGVLCTPPNAYGSVDLFSKYSINPSYGIPNNICATNANTRLPSQDTYIGLLTWLSKPNSFPLQDEGIREYIGKGVGNLQAGKAYYGEFWFRISCASNYANYDIGFIVSARQPFPTLPPQRAIVANNTNFSNYNWFSNYRYQTYNATGTWKKVAGAFIAQAGQNFMMVGNFQPVADPGIFSSNASCVPPDPQFNNRLFTYTFVDDLYLGKLADAGPDVTVDCSKPTTTLSIACANDRYLDPNAAGIPGATYTWKWVDFNNNQQAVVGTTITPSNFLFKQGTTAVTLEVKYTNTDGGIVTGTDEVIVNNPCCYNAIPPTPPTTFYINPDATQGIGPILDIANTVSIKTSDYGGTITLSGVYKIIGNVYFYGGNVIVKPGTQFFFYPSPTSTKPIEWRDSRETEGMFISIDGSISDGGKLSINSATFTNGTNTAWGGIYVGAYSELEIKGDVCNTQISNSFYGIKFYDEPISKKYFIDRCSFVNNINTSIIMWGHSINNSYIKKSLFLSKYGQLKNSIKYGIVSNNSNKITDTHLRMLNAYGTYIYPNNPKTPALIEDCYFESSINGILAENHSHKIQRNTFKDIASIAYLNYSNNNTDGNSAPDYNAGLNTLSANYLFQNNSIQLPSNWPATPQLPTTNKTSYGIFNTMRANSLNNVITGADNASFNLLTRIGIYNASPFSTWYSGNALTNLHQGMRLKTFNNGTAKIENNNFVGNLDALRIANAGATSSMVTTLCNSFTNPAARAGTAAIRVEEQAFLNSLQNSGGGNIYPNANAFSGMAKPIEFLGQNTNYTGFNYLRSTSAMENPSGFQIHSTTQPPRFFTASSYAGGCTGTTGAKRVGIADEVTVSEGEAKEMLNQIRFKYVNAQDQNQYLRKVIAYYGIANKMGDLYTWQKPMNRFNKRAANTLGLFLMDYFRAEGKETEAQAVANALLTTNADSKEIAARVKYFNLPQPTAKNKTARTGDATEERDEVLKELAYSGTSVADLACMLLRLNISNADCPEPDTTASNARSGSLDPEDTEDEVSTDTYLGNCLPNPAKDETVIYFYVPEEASKGVLKINSAATGAFIKEYTVSGKDYITLNLANFASGVYTYTLQVNDIPVATKKLVVVK